MADRCRWEKGPVMRWRQNESLQQMRENERAREKMIETDPAATVAG